MTLCLQSRRQSIDDNNDDGDDDHDDGDDDDDDVSVRANMFLYVGVFCC